MKKILLLLLFLFSIMFLASCGGLAPLDESQWKHVTRSHNFSNSTYHFESTVYESKENMKKILSFVDECKIDDEVNIELDRTTTKVIGDKEVTTSVREFYSLQYGIWVFGEPLDPLSNDGLYTKSYVSTDQVEPIVIIKKIFGDLTGSYFKYDNQQIYTKFSEIVNEKGVYVYEHDGERLEFYVKEDKTNTNTNFQVALDKVNFKWNRDFGRNTYYEEGTISFYDLGSTTVELPEIMYSPYFAMDYVADDAIHELYRASALNYEVESKYIDSNDYTLVSIRENDSNGEKYIYFGGQMSENVLALKYEPRVVTELVTYEDGEEIHEYVTNVVYLDVESDIISDIKCFCSERYYDQKINENPSIVGSLITKYTGLGLINDNLNIECCKLSYKVNGKEVTATASRYVSYVEDEIYEKPLCMFLTTEYELGDTYQQLSSPFSRIMRTEKETFAFEFSSYLPLIYNLNPSSKTQEELQHEYGKRFTATAIYVANVENLEDNKFVELINANTSPSINGKVLKLERTSGIFKYYILDNE